MRIGVRVRGDGNVPFKAHAWVECGGTVVTGAIEELADFKVLTTLRPQ